MVVRLTLRRLLGATALTAGIACTGGPVGPAGSPGPIGFPGGGTGPAATGLTGSWRRELVFIDEFGYVHSSATTWTFFAGGSAVRTIVTTNVTLGVADQSVAEAVWRTDGSNLIVEFTSPNPGTIVLDYRVEGSTLLLAGQEYQRTR